MLTVRTPEIILHYKSLTLWNNLLETAELLLEYGATRSKEYLIKWLDIIIFINNINIVFKLNSSVSYVSFYGILTKNRTALIAGARNENIAQALNSDRWQYKFPMYADCLIKQFRKAEERKQLLKVCESFPSSLPNGLSSLIVIQKIIHMDCCKTWKKNLVLSTLNIHF